MNAQEKAKAGVWLLKQAVVDYLRTRPEGASASEIREQLGIDDADAEGEHKGYLLWGLQHLLAKDGVVKTNKDVRPQRMMLLETRAT
jgi:hypothetical protein